MNHIFDLVGRILISAIFFFEAIDSIMFAEKMKDDDGRIWNHLET